MNNEHEVSVYTDDIEAVERNALPGPGVSIASVVKVSGEALTDSIKNTLGVLARSVSEAMNDIEKYSVSEIRFRLRIAASGEVSIISLVKGGAHAESGIEVVLRPSESRETQNSVTNRS